MASNLLSITVLAAFAVHFSATQQACQENAAASRAVEDLKRQFAALQRKVQVLEADRQSAVAFQVALSKTHVPASKIAFDKIIYNYGNHWNRITHSFRAPTKGLYSFTLTIMNGHRSSAAWAQINRGSTNIQRTWARSFGDVASASAVVLLNAGEYVSARHGGGLIDSNRIDHWTHFVGVLIHRIK